MKKEENLVAKERVKSKQNNSKIKLEILQSKRGKILWSIRN